MKQSPEGLVCFFTIKNPSFPDYISNKCAIFLAKSDMNACFCFCFCFQVTTESGVMCCDIHQKYPYLMVIGKVPISININTNKSIIFTLNNMSIQRI